MAVLKCKMCGGALEVMERMTVCECEYCGTQQTITTTKDENMQALFNRANILRMKSEFDKAEQLYEKLVQNNPDDAEAHWGLILCKFGIEYVEDPQSFKRIPTCHRTSFDSIIADEDYKEALRCADSVQREVYQREAKEIDRIQKEILALSAKEEPYDVFICYKETDDSGSRTQDSVIANDIYYQLKTEGFKVFYAAITLEDKLGSAYEPCIFAALNSAKVMLAIGTKPEYFGAVWVKNEWSRFLKMMKKDRTKLLIPCYKNMDAYELPEEFAHLQAQDMGKIGFINDVVRGIKKVIVKDEPKPVQTVVKQVTAGNANVESLLKKAFIFLEDGDWQSADEYCEKVLDLDPENGRAYLGKLMAEKCVREQDDLKNLKEPFDNNTNYKKIIRYGDEQLIDVVKGYIAAIEERKLLEQKEDVYQKALTVYNDRRSKKKDITKAKEAFESLSGYKDADEYVRKYEDRLKEAEYQRAVRISRDNYISSKGFDKEDVFEPATNTGKSADDGKKAVTLFRSISQTTCFRMAAEIFESMPGYKDADERAKKLRERIEEAKKSSIHSNAKERLDDAKEEFSKGTQSKDIQQITKSGKMFWEAKELFRQVESFKDSKERIKECEEKEKECEQAIIDINTAKQAAEIAAEKAKKRKKILTIIAVVAVLAAAGAIFTITYINSETKYNHAVELMNSGNYAQAKTAFEELGDYRDSADLAAESGFVTLSDEDEKAILQKQKYILCGEYYTVGLKADGTVASEGGNSLNLSDRSDWKDIIAISSAYDHTIGLKADGTVVATGDNAHGQCNVSNWKNIIAVVAGETHTVGLKADETVVAVGSKLSGKCNVSDWKDIIAVSVGEYHTVGLKADGTVVAMGKNDGQCNVSGWKLKTE